MARRHTSLLSAFAIVLALAASAAALQRVVPLEPEGATQILPGLNFGDATYGDYLSGYGAICADESWMLLPRFNAILRFYYWGPLQGTLEVLAGSTASPAGTSGFGVDVGFVDGVGTAARFEDPSGVALDSACRYAYVADYINNLVRRIEVATRTVTTIGGNMVGAAAVAGQALSSPIHYPYWTTLSPDERVLFVLAANGGQLLSIRLSDGVLAVEAGQYGVASTAADGVGTSALIEAYKPVALRTGELLFPDLAGAAGSPLDATVLRKFNPVTKAVTTVAGVANSAARVDGFGTNARFTHMSGAIAYNSFSHTVYVVNGNNYIRKIDMNTLEVTSLLLAAAPSGAALPTGFPDGLLLDAQQDVAFYVADDGVHAIRLRLPNPARIRVAGGASLVLSSGGNVTVGG
eukprot:tig00000147_g9456.t1